MSPLEIDRMGGRLGRRFVLVIWPEAAVDSKRYISRMWFYNQIRREELPLSNVMVITDNHPKPAPDKGSPTLVRS